MAIGVVEKVNDWPPSAVDKSEPELVDETVKSDATAVVAPTYPDTEMVQIIVRPIRDGEVFVH